jgi:hypothetical protein
VHGGLAVENTRRSKAIRGSDDFVQKRSPFDVKFVERTMARLAAIPHMGLIQHRSRLARTQCRCAG